MALAHRLGTHPNDDLVVRDLHLGRLGGVAGRRLEILADGDAAELAALAGFGPALLVACEINFADSDSPSALITAASLSCSDFMTSNFALSASCCATCFASIAREYSWLKLKCVNATSSNKIPKSSARFLKLFAICSVTSCLLVNNSSALYCATVAFNTSFPIDGNTRSS